jgi:hypothetical protein
VPQSASDPKRMSAANFAVVKTLLLVDVVECRIRLRKIFYLRRLVRIFKVLEEEEHAKAEPSEPNAVFDGLSPEEFAAQFFGDGSTIPLNRLIGCCSREESKLKERRNPALSYKSSSK